MKIGRRELIAGVMALPVGTLSLHAEEVQPGSGPATGQVKEVIALQPSDPDPHGAAIHNGYLYSCDAGIGSGPSSQGSDPGELFRFKL